MNTEIKSFMGYKLDVNGDIEGAIPTIEVHQQMQNTMKQFTENQNNFILDYCTKLKIDPVVLEKQLKEIQMLKMIIKQKDEQIEKMKCCENCAKIETCKLFAHIDIHVCDKWELAE